MIQNDSQIKHDNNITALISEIFYHLMKLLSV